MKHPLAKIFTPVKIFMDGTPDGYQEKLKQ